MDRVFLLNPGQSLDVGDRLLTAFRPPLFDNPATVGFQEDATGVVFSSDCFGGPMNSAELATCGNLQDVPDEDRRAAQLLWAAVDSPWVVEVDRQRYEPTVEHVRALNASAILSTHLPPAVAMNDAMITSLLEAPDTTAFVGPDQAALETLLATFEPV